MSRRRAKSAPTAPSPTTSCPCGLPAAYNECCGRLHLGRATAGTAEQLMRPRFSAFARHHRAYLLRTRPPGRAGRTKPLRPPRRLVGLPRSTPERLKPASEPKGRAGAEREKGQDPDEGGIAAPADRRHRAKSAPEESRAPKNSEDQMTS